jgi:hypothetical protein
VKYVIVQCTGFMPYFLCAWSAGTDQWDCHRDRALVFDGSTARRIAGQLNAHHPGSPVPVTVDTVKHHNTPNAKANAKGAPR